MNGIINVLKPPGMTSHDVVNFIRKQLKIKKVGHAGTLDPEAAGVLPICIGKSTKAVQYLMEKRKKYRANIKFGITTTTHDKYGEIIRKTQTPDLDQETITNLINSFKGKIFQIPPMYSAIKYKGKKLYQYALEGKKIDIKGRWVEIYDIKVIDKIHIDEFMIDISCSKGTYIRTLCHDIGEKSGYGAHMSQLIRLEVSPFIIEESITLEEISVAVRENSIYKLIYPPDMLFTHYEIIHIKKTAEKSALNGNPVFAPGLDNDIEKYKKGTIVRLYIDNKFIAIGTIEFDEKLKRNYVKIKTLFT
ncbi:MAG: tRNA pseudouridine(55) synthase TruB [Clostridiales bacterium]|nr:tRNA pseudouridine(55) synthase TruB [Clostridiales bacterium]